MAQDNFGLLLAALVGIVAVVGLVVLFNSQNTGAAVCAPGEVATYQFTHGSLICVPSDDVVQIGYPRPVGHSGDFQYGRQYPPGLSTGGYGPEY